MKRTIVSMVVMAMFAVMPASAQGIAFGVKGGVNGTKMSIDNDAVKSETGIGFFVGPTLKIDILPFFGVQGALLYEQANSKVNGEKIKRQSVIVPIDARLNLKFNEDAGIYLTTGPQLGFNVGDNDFTWNEASSYKSTFQMKKSMFNWNFGVGAMLTKHVEVGAVYSLGISKTGELEAEIDKAKANNNEIKPKSSTWQISATLFF
ncbi:MAG: PorT family protein [Prevotella sp.]|nr:PorT family protein [Prevotella sp.]